MADLMCVYGNDKHLEYYLKGCLTHINDHIAPLYSSPFNFGTLLCSAIHGKSIECIKYLLNNGADPNKCDDYGRSPLVFTFHVVTDDAKLLEIIEMLLKAGADPNVSYYSHDKGVIYPLVYADMRGNKDLINLLLKYGAHKKAHEVEHLLSEHTINEVERIYDRQCALLALYKSNIPLDVITDILIKECL